MSNIKETKRSKVIIGYNNQVSKWFTGPQAKERYYNEVQVLLYLEKKSCPFVPRLLKKNDSQKLIVTSNCGQKVDSISEEKVKGLFDELKKYGVLHEDQAIRNVTYNMHTGRFCLIDFEFATILEKGFKKGPIMKSYSEMEAWKDSSKILIKKIVWAGCSNIGRYRKKNEDNFIALKLNNEGVFHLGKFGRDDNSNGDFVFAISDGMGGAKAGDFASKIVVEQISLIFPKIYNELLNQEIKYLKDILERLIIKIHQEISLLGSTYKELEGMGATLSLLWIHKNKAYWVHVGDSRIYHLDHSSKFKQLTNDDTHIAHLLREGKISKYEARNHSQRNILSKVIGGKTKNIKPQIGECELRNKDEFIICSDGLTSALLDSQIKRFIEGNDYSVNDFKKNLASDLVNQAVRDDGKDNTTAISFKLSDCRN